MKNNSHISFIRKHNEQLLSGHFRTAGKKQRKKMNSISTILIILVIINMGLCLVNYRVKNYRPPVLLSKIVSNEVVYDKNLTYYPEELLESSYRKQHGMVPDINTAARIAEAIWYKVYGKNIYLKRPYTVRLINHQIWAVTNVRFGDKTYSDRLYIEINKLDGRILKVAYKNSLDR